MNYMESKLGIESNQMSKSLLKNSIIELTKIKKIFRNNLKEIELNENLDIIINGTTKIDREFIGYLRKVFFFNQFISFFL